MFGNLDVQYNTFLKRDTYNSIASYTFGLRTWFVQACCTGFGLVWFEDMCCTGLSTGLFWFGFPWYLLGTYIIGMSCTCSICLTFKRFIFPIHVERTYQTSITFKELTGLLGNISLTCLNRNDLNTFLDKEYNKFCKEKMWKPTGQIKAVKFTDFLSGNHGPRFKQRNNIVCVM